MHVAEIMREGDEIGIHREQHQFDRHQDDDDVATVQENTDDADRKQNRAEHEVMGKGQHDFYLLSAQLFFADADSAAAAAAAASSAATVAGLFSDGIFTTRTRSCARTLTWSLIFWRLLSFLWLVVSAIAAMIATSSTRPATS